MFEVVLHTGTEHPNLLWIVAASLLSFAGGVGVGMFTRTSRESDDSTTTSEGSP